jgi:Domain of Unknown Function (DUF1080)
MNTRLIVSLKIFLATLLLAGCAHQSQTPPAAGWTAMFDGKSISGWRSVGDANWRVMDGAIVADQGVGFLVSAAPYADFQMRAEFWADADVNSGIFIRATEPEKITPANSYEVNIYDKRPDPTYGTGAIVDVAKVSPMPKAVGQWNVFEITAKGTQLTVTMNGVQTANVQDSKHARGPIALQYAKGASPNAGFIKFRKVDIKPL